MTEDAPAYVVDPRPEPWSLRLVLPVPPSTNDLYERRLGFTKRGKPYRATRLKGKVEEFRYLVVQAITAQVSVARLKAVPPRLAITIRLRDGAAKIDVDNATKSLVDAIKGPLGFDDGPHRVRRVVAEYVAAGEPCEVVLQEWRAEGGERE